MFAVYVRSWSWGANGRSERWNLLATFEEQHDAERRASEVGGLVVREAAAA